MGTLKLQHAEIYNILSNKHSFSHLISVGSRREELHSGGRVPGLGCVQPAGGGWHSCGQGLLCPEGDLQVRLEPAHYCVMQLQLYIIRSDPIESRFAILLEDFAPSQNWRQHRLLSEPAIKATLRAFAKLHGFFWRGSSFWQRGGPAAEQLEDSVWRSGSYWQPSMQPPEQLDQVASAWDRHREAFGPAFSEAKELAGIDLTSLGVRLQRVVHRAGQSAHPFNDPESSEKYSSWRTLIHGDAKSANIFLRDSREGQTHVEVGLIDFQWLSLIHI